MVGHAVLGSPRKRKAESIDQESDTAIESDSDIEILHSREIHDPKRSKPARELGFQLIEVTVQINKRLAKILPDALDDRLVEDYCRTIGVLMRSLDTGTMQPPRFLYSIVIGSCVRGKNPDFDFATVTDGIPDIGQANKEAFKEFMLDKLIGLKRENFVELETREGLTNPRFLRLHAVRAGDVGWGFDCDGCLSLFMTTDVSANLRDKVFYVKRTQLKVESAEQ